MAGESHSATPLCRAPEVSEGTLSLAAAVGIALCNNADVRTARTVIDTRQAQVGEARSAYWPTVSLVGSETREWSRNANVPTITAVETETTVYGAVTWRLFDFGGRSADYFAATKFLQSAFRSEDATVQRVLGSVVETYYDTLTAKALVNDEEEDCAVAENALASAVRRLAGGNAAQSDVLQSRTALERTRLELNRARGDLEKSTALLKYILGLEPNDIVRIPADAYDDILTLSQSVGQWLDDARMHHPAIQAARADLEAAEAQVRSERASGRPTVDLQVNYYANGYPQQGIAPQKPRDTTVGLSISIPVFDGFLHRYKVQEAEATVRSKEIALADAVNITLREVVKAYADAMSAIDNLKQSQELVTYAQESQMASQRRYDKGVADIAELLNTQGSLSDAHLQQLRSQAEWRSARLRLLATAGILSSESLKSPEP